MIAAIDASEADFHAALGSRDHIINVCMNIDGVERQLSLRRNWKLDMNCNRFYLQHFGNKEFAFSYCPA